MNISDSIMNTATNKRIKRHVFFWLIFYVLMVIAYPPHGGGTPNGLEKDGFIKFYEMSVIRTAFHFFCQIILCYPLLYILMPLYFWEKKYVRFICFLLVLYFLVAIIRYSMYIFIYNPLMNSLGLYVEPVHVVLLLSFRQTFTGPAFIGFLFITIKIFKDWQQKQTDNLNLLKENYKAELQLLKAQIHPHFLFNTLNNIYFFVLSEPAKAKHLVKKLEKLLYYIINECNEPTVPLSKEINMIHDYLELEKIRYSNIDIDLKITGDYKNKKIAPLLMLPFIENSFKHGASKMISEPWIKLFIQADEHLLHFIITNNKPAYNIVTERHGIGLNNVKKRLRLLYSEKYFLNIEPTDNTFTVNMQIPLE